ncbi:MAG: AAA family ATPase [Spirochaetota bacterium]
MYDRMRRLLDALSTELHERDDAIRLGVLAAAAGESLFLLGPPGTGKSLIARRLQQAFRDATAFTYLMGRFSTPDEVFGPLSIRALREQDRFERNIKSYLPDADVVFLDEIWKASPPIQNALLTALNERRYRNGTEEIAIPMKLFVGASNELPHETEEAAAFWDRFLVRLVVDPIRDRDAFVELLGETRDPYRTVVPEELRITNDEYVSLRAAEATVIIPPNVVDLISAIRDSLASGGPKGDSPIYVSDRRWKKTAGLLRMSAVLHGRDRVEAIDCAIIRACAWSSLEERPLVDDIVSAQLAAYSGHGAVAERFAARLDEIRSSYRRLSARVVQEEKARPAIYRDEYYRLLPPEGSPLEKDELLLVWHGDVDDLRREGNAEADLFVYDANGQLAGSQRSAVRLAGEWRLRVDDREYAIETTVQRIEKEESRSLDDEERVSLTTEIGGLIAELDESLDELVGEQERLEDGAHAHLFVPVSDAAVVLEAIRATARRLSEVRLLAVELSATITGA